ncbi:MAG: bifunctional pyr operon transcriptional regulator/uracil phosphoribosyltransferase PyrR [Saprospiraceae bacterium]|nr:bifunctional pyr operon transcriptional regulator/uracil phosphoribosyltransferase PyrR [Saprospiraceae bacterium]
MQQRKILLQQNQFSWVIERICCQLVERFNDFENTCLIGVQPRGVMLAERIFQTLKMLQPETALPEFGKLDITFYRDDFRRHNMDWTPKETDINFLIENKNVILVDDVLYTGRTIHAAISALQHFGRPNCVELVVLVDRRFNRDLPIQCTYRGISVDTLGNAHVRVMWASDSEIDKVELIEK